MSFRPEVIFWSLMYLRPSMIYWRVHRTVKGAGIRFMEKARLAERMFDRPVGDVSVSPVPRLSSRYHCEEIDLAERRFSFLQDVLVLPEDADEMRAAVARKPLLWQFHFGYHDYLLALMEDTDTDPLCAGKVLDFMEEWMRVYPLYTTGARRSAWHPYVLSIRIEAWIRLHARVQDFGVDTSDPRLAEIARSIELMTRVLLRNLEKGTMANHLLRNIKALVLAGLFLDTSTGAQARRIGLTLLEREIREQVLDDGCHFERSPMYHVSMTSDVLDIAEAITLSESTVPEALSGAAARMTAFLEHMRHPDGEIPYFNDATRSFFLRTAEVLERGHRLCEEMDWPGHSDAPEDTGAQPKRVSGLLTAQMPRSWVVFDAGNVGPDYQPGHTHCDTLSFEWSLDGDRFVTDTGVYHYRESPERFYSRSTAAHNTIEIEGEDQSEVWKSFRVGRRAKILEYGREEIDGVQILRGAHDGYERLERGLVHERAILLAPAWLAVIDWLHGTGIHRYRSFLHLHPSVEIQVAAEHIRLRRGAHDIILHSLGPESVISERTEYYPAFGEKILRPSVLQQNEARFPLITGNLFVLDGHDIPLHIDPLNKSVTFRLPRGKTHTIGSMM